MSANKSVIKTLKILELISKSTKGLTLSEIYKELDMPKASVYDILQALYAEDAVYYKNEVTKTYVIGSKLFTIGQAYTKNSNFIAFASPLLKDFANKYGVTAFGCKRLGTKTTYIFKCESPKTRLATPDVGVQIPLYESAAGMAFLSFLDNEKIEDLLNRIKVKDFNGKNTRRYEQIIKDIANNQKLGYIFDNGQSDHFVCDIAFPVYNFEKKMTGAIFATRLVIDESLEDVEQYVNEFKNIAKIISIKQGYQE